MYTYARADAHTTQAHLLAWVNLQVMRPLFCACVRICLLYYFLKLCGMYINEWASGTPLPWLYWWFSAALTLKRPPLLCLPGMHCVVYFSTPVIEMGISLNFRQSVLRARVGCINEAELVNQFVSCREWLCRARRTLISRPIIMRNNLLEDCAYYV